MIAKIFQASDLETSSCSMAAAFLNYCNLETCLHVCCATYTKEQSLNNLMKARDLGIRNILALRGDLDDQDSSKYELPHACDLVRQIRQEFGNYFTVAVAGYPSGHPESSSYEEDLFHLKEKVEYSIK